MKSFILLSAILIASNVSGQYLYKGKNQQEVIEELSNYPQWKLAGVKSKGAGTEVHFVKHKVWEDPASLVYYFDNKSGLCKIKSLYWYPIESLQEKIKEFNKLYSVVENMKWLDTKTGITYSIDINDNRYAIVEY